MYVYELPIRFLTLFGASVAHSVSHRWAPCNGIFGASIGAFIALWFALNAVAVVNPGTARQGTRDGRVRWICPTVATRDTGGAPYMGKVGTPDGSITGHPSIYSCVFLHKIKQNEK